MKKYIFKTIKTPKGCYIYDRSYNRVFRVAENEFDEFLNVENGIMDADASAVIQKYSQDGVLGVNQLREIEHPETKLLAHYADCRLKQLTLQVTQQCNLRCAYCVYSGNYYTREHSDKKMPWEIALKALDYMISHSTETEEVCFSFYGGEPLLEFEMIKKSVLYVEENMEGRKFTFAMTTNGTLLNPEVAEFLAEHKFSLAISLDGSKEEHDANRCFRNGTGSFDIIEKNIMYIKEHFHDFWENIQFLITLNPKSNLEHILTFFETSEMLPHKLLQFNELSDTNLKNDALVRYEADYTTNMRFMYLKALWALAGQYDKKKVDPVLQRILFDREQFAEELKKSACLACKAHPGGPCIPGIKRLFVSVDGTFFPCEKVDETLPGMVIGTIEEGLDIEKMSRVINIGKLTAERCMDCIAFQNCRICIERITGDFDSDFVTPASKQAVCKETIDTFLSMLYQYCIIEECKAGGGEVW